MPDQHNRRRRYRKGYEPHDGATTFDALRTLVRRLLDHVRVDIRINLDHANGADLLPLVELARNDGWFECPYPAVIQPARLAAYSERSGFLRRSELSVDEFDRLKANLRVMASDVRTEECEAPDGVPQPKTSVCAALAADSVVVGAEGLLYRCGLQVGEKHRAVGRLDGDLNGDRVQPFRDLTFWDQFDPTIAPRCGRCSFLPLCWGGCPKKHLEGDTHALEEQSRYWRHNLPRLISAAAGEHFDKLAPFTESDQFRDGPPPAAFPQRVIALLNADATPCQPKPKGTAR